MTSTRNYRRLASTIADLAHLVAEDADRLSVKARGLPSTADPDPANLRELFQLLLRSTQSLQCERTQVERARDDEPE